MKVINLWEVIPENEHSDISDKVWQALDKAGIDVSEDAELSIKIYDEDHIIDIPEFNNVCDI
tara:strand:- start:163 stop:348 length:186 start_codon:yes stop_codon:yes gene_type:complete